jgi:hypothetical protein
VLVARPGRQPPRGDQDDDVVVRDDVGLALRGSGARNAERSALLRRNRPAVDLRVRGFHYVGLKACRGQRQ